MFCNRIPFLAALAAYSLIQVSLAAEPLASTSTSTVTGSAPTSAASTSKIIAVVVGSPTLNKSLVFTPSEITANPGDIVQFQFSQINHTVTQSTFAAPCQPIQAADPAAAGVHSGFIPTVAGAAEVPTFNMPINNTTPMFFYCAQGPHCQLGMVMTVNAAANETFAMYKSAAANAKSNVPAQLVKGGVFGTIPSAMAAKAPV